MLKHAKNIFFVGIKGVAMANLAVFLKKTGKNVTGSDIEEIFITDKLLENNDIKYQIGFNNLPKNIDLIVYSAAHKGLNNPLLIKAKKTGINIISQAELLGEIMRDFKIKIAVSGCHGKTTTTSLLSYALNKLKAKPSYIVGVPFFTDYQGGDFQSKNYFIVEADEYGINPPTDKTPKFFKLNPDWIITTNIDFDHPDVYQDIEETKNAFIKFFDNKNIIINIDDKNLAAIKKILKNNKIITYGFSQHSDYQITNTNINEYGSEFKIKDLGDFKISLFGRHNILNATSVIVQLIKLGFKLKDIKKAIVNFKGAERRFDLQFSKNNFYLVDDYAHHPSEIKATINAARERFKNKKIIVIFQPHTFTRTSLLLKEFKESLSNSDFGLILPIFASARESKEKFNITSNDIVKNSTNLKYCLSNEEVINSLKDVIRTVSGGVIITMGAGDVYKLKDKIIELINDGPMNFLNSALKIEKNKDISHFLTLRNKVNAEYFIETKKREDLVNAKKYSLENNLPFLVIGGGSNFAILTKIIKGLVVKNNYFDLKVIKENKNNVIISVSSGYPVSLLISKSIENGWSGFEHHQGLPGTVGGAIFMNSKWTHPLTYFGDNLIYAYLIDDKGIVKKVDKKYFEFAYDYSILQKTKEILLEAIFQLKKDNREEIKKRAKFALDYRKKTQPFGIATSGCFFRNPGNISAGYLIDKAGLKGYSIGDYYISNIHANFIINKGHGKKEDLLKLINLIKKTVKNKFNVDLKEEVIVIK